MFLISYLGVRHAAELKLPLLQSLVLSAQEAESERTQAFLQQNLNAMAVKLGEMQAQLMRLDALGERLSAVAGIRPSEFRFGEIPGRGGARSSRCRRRTSRSATSASSSTSSRARWRPATTCSACSNRSCSTRGEEEADADHAAGEDGS